MAGGAITGTGITGAAGDKRRLWLHAHLEHFGRVHAPMG
jgi:hypothetical protein